MTGAPMPRGCDAVLPAEFVEVWWRRGSSRTPRMTSSAISRRLARQEHRPARRRHRPRARRLLDAGRLLRPQDIGVHELDRPGRSVRVVRRPRVRLVDHRQRAAAVRLAPHDFQITDANGPMLAALAERDGGDRRFPRPRARRCAMRSSPRCMPTPTSSSCPAARASASRTWRRRLWPRMANWPCTASRCDRAARPAWAASSDRLVFLLPGNPVSCAVRLRLLRRPRDSRARRPRQGLAVPLESARRWRARSARRSDGSTTPACESTDGRVEPLVGRRRVGAVVDDARRRLRHRRRRQRRLRCGH